METGVASSKSLCQVAHISQPSFIELIHQPFVPASATNAPNILSLQNFKHLLQISLALRLPIYEAVLLVISILEHLGSNRTWDVTKKAAAVLYIE